LSELNVSTYEGVALEGGRNDKEESVNTAGIAGLKRTVEAESMVVMGTFGAAMLLEVADAVVSPGN
jgi:hypothetical protein